MEYKKEKEIDFMITAMMISKLVGTTSIIFLFGIIAGELYTYQDEKKKWKKKKKI